MFETNALRDLENTWASLTRCLPRPKSVFIVPTGEISDVLDIITVLIAKLDVLSNPFTVRGGEGHQVPSDTKECLTLRITLKRLRSLLRFPMRPSSSYAHISLEQVQ